MEARCATIRVPLVPNYTERCKWKELSRVSSVGNSLDIDSLRRRTDVEFIYYTWYIRCLVTGGFGECPAGEIVWLHFKEEATPRWCWVYDAVAIHGRCWWFFRWLYKRRWSLVSILVDRRIFHLYCLRWHPWRMVTRKITRTRDRISETFFLRTGGVQTAKMFHTSVRSRSTVSRPSPAVLRWCARFVYCSTDPTQEKTCPGACRLYGSHPVAWARSYRSGICLSSKN